MERGVNVEFSMRNMRWGKIILFVFAFLLLGLSSIYTYKYAIVPSNAEGKKVFSQEENDFKLGLTQGETISQEINVDARDMFRIAILFEKEEDNGSVLIELNKKNGELIQSWEYALKDIPSDTMTVVELTEPINIENEKYILNINVDEEASGKVSLAYSEKDSILTLKKGNTPIKGILNMYIFEQSKNIIRNMFFAVFILFVFILFFGIWLIDEKKIENSYLFLIIGIGLIYIIIFPTGTEPDGRTHFASVYAESSELLGLKAVDSEGKAILYEKGYDLYTHPDRNSVVSVFEKWNDTNYKTVESLEEASVIDVNIFLYFPQIIGVTLARFFSLNAFWVMYVGRILALLFYAFINWGALKLMPFGKMAIFLISFLPMSLELGTSYSYDGMLIALSFLSISYNFYLIYEKEIVNVKDWVILSVLCILLTNIKLVYIFIPMLCLMIDKKKCIKKKACCAVVILSGVVSIIITQLNRVLSVLSQTPTAVEGAGEYYSVSYVIRNLIKTIWIVYCTLEERMDFYFTSTLGNRLGWLEIQIPFIIVVLFFILIMVASIKGKTESAVIELRQRSFYILICAMTFMAIIATLMLSYTPFGSSLIEGVQGRYFLPFLPILMISLMRNSYLALNKPVNTYMIWICIILQNYTVQHIIRRIVTR